MDRTVRMRYHINRKTKDKEAIRLEPRNHTGLTYDELMEQQLKNTKKRIRNLSISFAFFWRRW